TESHGGSQGDGQEFRPRCARRRVSHEHESLQRDEWDLRKAFQSALSRPHDDRGSRAAAWGLRRDRPRRQGLRRITEVNPIKYTFHIVDVLSPTPFGGN